MPPPPAGCFRRSFAVTLILAAATGLRAAPAPQQPVPDELDLKTSIGFAVENNFAIRQARERIKQQDGVVIEVRARQIPNVTAGGTYQRNSDNLSQSFPASDRSWNVSLTASQSLYSGGGVAASVEGSRRTRDAALLDLRSVIRDSILEVRVAFYSVLLAGEKVKVQEQNIELLQGELKNITDRFDAGTVSSFEKTRVEVSLANAQVPLITARNDRRLAIESLRQALGFTTNTPENLRKIPTFLGSLQYQPVQLELETALEGARTNRPDLQRLAKLVEARKEAVTAARAGYRPNVALVGGWELRKGATNGFGDSESGVFVGLQSTWNVFDGRATGGRVAQANSALEQARLQVADATLAVEVEVRTAFSIYQEATELAEASQKVVTQAEESVRLANARYTAGTATQLDVLQSNVDLTTARTNQVQAFYSYNVAVARLRKAMGQSDEFVSE